ncbi:MAG: lysylphosphatidylglycerol synthase transmembrane domain-containing protein [bacterium]
MGFKTNGDSYLYKKQMKKHPEKRLKISISVIVLLICFFFIGKSFFVNLHDVDFHKLKFDWIFLFLSLACILLGGLINGWLWQINLIYIGEKISYIQSLRVISLSYLPKYIPGKVFGIASQVWLTKEEGSISGTKGSIGAILNMGVSILGGALLGCSILPFVLKNKLPINIYFLLGFIPVLFIILYPPIFIRASNWFLKILKRDIITFIPHYGQILKLLFLNISFWIFQTIAIFFLIRSFYPIGLSFLVPLCGIFPGASVIALLSFFTPGGLGVREGVLSYLFSFFMPTSIGIVASIVMRLLGTIGEIILFAIFAKNIKKYVTQTH